MRARGFTLLEMIVVVAVLAVIAAVSVPNLLPVLQIQQLESSASTVAAFLARARGEAMARRRCVRVTLPDARTVVAEVLNSYDCEDPDAVTTPEVLIDANRPVYIEIARLVLPGSITATFAPAPDEEPSGEPDQIRFRSTGRLFSNDTSVLDDEGAIQLTHARIASLNTKLILVESQGTICIHRRGQALSGAAGAYNCPS